MNGHGGECENALDKEAAIVPASRAARSHLKRKRRGTDIAVTRRGAGRGPPPGGGGGGGKGKKKEKKKRKKKRKKKKKRGRRRGGMGEQKGK
ncbi:hypothetical protein GSH05_01085 [Burkholderia pseudomallei]|nr:hypothetical protein [Burkholderia pseudomallei]